MPVKAMSATTGFGSYWCGLTALHPVLARAVRVGCDTFASEWGDFTVEPELGLSDNVDTVSIAPGDFSEAVVNL